MHKLSEGRQEVPPRDDDKAWMALQKAEAAWRYYCDTVSLGLAITKHNERLRPDWMRKP